ncbi:MAG: DNA-processing protein DprA [Acidobacteriota bacterium]
MTNDPKDLNCWLALTLVPDVGILTANRLLRSFGSPGAIFRASLEALTSSGVVWHAADEICSGRLLEKAEVLAAKASDLGVLILTQADPRYPELLGRIADPPILLYTLGDPAILAESCVAVVGARKPSTYGLKAAEWLAGELARRGLCIVSGLARGIDTAAHRSALEAQGKTAAVLGSGVDLVYPRENFKIYRQIIESGVVVSEFPLSSHPAPQNFPVRNRILSGLSLGTLVVEAAQFSGSLITARLALEQNREVFAVPGNITSSKSFGPNYLIKQGAKMVQAVDDILDELPASVRRTLRDATERPDLEATLGEEARVVLRNLHVDAPQTIDELLERTGLPLSRVSLLLFELESAGHVECMAGNRYLRKYLGG